jgi:hypothetical protein
MIKPTSKHRVGAIDLNRFETTTPIPIVARIAPLALGTVRNIVWESDNLKQVRMRNLLLKGLSGPRYDWDT